MKKIKNEDKILRVIKYDDKRLNEGYGYLLIDETFQVFDTEKVSGYNPKCTGKFFIHDRSKAYQGLGNLEDCIYKCECVSDSRVDLYMTDYKGHYCLNDHWKCLTLIVAATENFGLNLPLLDLSEFSLLMKKSSDPDLELKAKIEAEKKDNKDKASFLEALIKAYILEQYKAGIEPLNFHFTKDTTTEDIMHQIPYYKIARHIGVLKENIPAFIKELELQVEISGTVVKKQDKKKTDSSTPKEIEQEFHKLNVMQKSLSEQFNEGLPLEELTDFKFVKPSSVSKSKSTTKKTKTKTNKPNSNVMSLLEFKGLVPINVKGRRGARFIVSIRKNGEYQFNLTAVNGQVILTSEGYTTNAACINGIVSVIKNAENEERYDRLTAKNGKLYFNLKASNGRIIGNSEMYETQAGRENGIRSVMKNASVAGVEIQDKF